MKITYIDNQLHAVAESQGEAIALASFAANMAQSDVAPREPKQKKEKKTRKLNYKRDCDVPGCSKKVKGLQGLGIHKKKVHGISATKHTQPTLTKNIACDTCGRYCATLRGLGVHKATMHKQEPLHAYSSDASQPA